MTARIGSMSLVLVVAVVGGCSVYDSRFAFDPGPVDVPASRPGSPDAEPVRTLVTVLGVRRADDRSAMPPGVDVRLRVDNTSPYQVTFDPAMLVLFSAGLERFAEPIVIPAEPIELAPGGSGMIDASFPFPEAGTPNDMDLSGLNVRWTLVIDGESVTSSATFERLPRGYYDRHPYRIGVGFQRY